MELERSTLVDGLIFGEAPRWHDGRLWFSDMHAPAVFRTDLDGRCEKIVDVPMGPSGLGFLPDGRLLIVSMADRRVLRLEGGRLVLHADLSAIATGPCNDMVVDHAGNAYVGNFGVDLARYPARESNATLALVTAAGEVRPAAEGLVFPNGSVITPDGRTLIVAETFAERLTAFDIRVDGTLGNRRVFAPIASSTPDGICLDAQGAVWVADPNGRQCLRVREGGRVTDRIPTGRGCYACMLGGPERKTLFLFTAVDYMKDKAMAAHNGKIETVAVEVPGAGLP